MKQETWTAAEYNRFVRLGVEPDKRPVKADSSAGREGTPEDRSRSEAWLQDKIIECAEATGWKYWHDRSRKKNKKGWPDLVLVRHSDGRMVVAELKRQQYKPNESQQAWLDAFSAVAEAASAQGADIISVHVWRPDDWPENIVRVLK